MTVDLEWIYNVIIFGSFFGPKTNWFRQPADDVLVCVAGWLVNTGTLALAWLESKS